MKFILLFSLLVINLSAQARSINIGYRVRRADDVSNEPTKSGELLLKNSVVGPPKGAPLITLNVNSKLDDSDLNDIINKANKKKEENKTEISNAKNEKETENQNENKLEAKSKIDNKSKTDDNQKNDNQENDNSTTTDKSSNDGSKKANPDKTKNSNKENN
ncbi:GATA zinc finger domain-containing protein 13-like [Contarinia nasturtii]|uniref:GATA zinc finger domain-containing protein 13-like n=1 Tax=Contarinia nasturtii TaxID=265458 RepID=UPI0012D42A21|nr:GATA zinc finger domain-containing protein 13-like [Contarinia nasturtii]